VNGHTCPEAGEVLPGVVLMRKFGGSFMGFFTAVLRRSGAFWVALCLENGLVGQGNTKEDALQKLKEAIESLQDVYVHESDVHSAPISIGELHEFLTVQPEEPAPDSYELRAVNA
jgi:predicted RNase H-like HicB family nuclease